MTPRTRSAGAALWLALLATFVRGEEKPGEKPAPEAAGGSFRFTDISREAGIAGAITLSGRPGKDHLLDSAGTGAAFLDFDRDGKLDIYIVNGWRLDGSRIVEKGRNTLFRGKGGGGFEDVTAKAKVSGEGHWASGAFAADHDGDGWTDILVTNFGPNLLYRNRGDGTFEEIGERAGIRAPAWNTGAAFFDAEGDGDLDLYIAAYIDCTLDDVLRAERTLDWKGLEKVAAGPFGMRGGLDRFFRAEPGGRFVEASAAAGFEDRAAAFGFAVRAADFDSDGDADVFVANDSDANYYFRNDGKGRFEEMGLIAGCAYNANASAQASMGIAAGDVTGDGITDIFVTTFAEDTSSLYRGIGDGLFEDATAVRGIVKPTYLPLAWGVAMADLDADGDLDIVCSNGHIYPQVDAHPSRGQTYAQKATLLENRGDTFVDATERAGPGFEPARSSRGLAVGDIDDDGDCDILMTALDSPPVLLQNDGPAGSWLIVALEDERGPIAPIGAVVTVTAGGRTMRRDVAAGDSYLSTHDPRPHFGLGAAGKAEKVEVRWPGGRVSVLSDVPARHILRIRRP